MANGVGIIELHMQNKETKTLNHISHIICRLIQMGHRLKDSRAENLCDPRSDKDLLDVIPKAQGLK